MSKGNERCDYCDKPTKESADGASWLFMCADCHAPQEPHTCPFKSEIRDDNETLCTCGKAQEHECAMDI